MSIDLKLPELGEGIDSADVLSILVKEGDEIQPEQGVIQIETNKATVDVPSTAAGRVTKIHVREGETIAVGATLMTLDNGGPSAPAAAEKARSTDQPATKQSAAKKPSSEKPDVEKPSPGGSAPASKPPSKSTAAKAGAPPTTTPSAPPSSPDAADDEADNATSESEHGDPHAPAGPATRRFARELGVDLTHVHGSGSGGRITREDVIAAVRQSNRLGKKPGEDSPTTSSASRMSTKSKTRDSGKAETSARETVWAERDAWGEIRREKLTKIRQTIAERMHASCTAIPHVTNFDQADVTQLEAQRQTSQADYARLGVKLTALPLVMKAVSLALRAHPMINASLDAEHSQIVYKNYVNIGIAVDTPRGLIVSVVRHVDRLSIPEIAGQLAAVALAARDNRFTLEDLRGGTFTISNLGAVGGSYSTPIINSPELAILLIGRSRKTPVVVDDRVEIRLMMPLSLSYDHRLIDGATAARFLNDVIDYLETPGRLLLAP